MVALSREKEEAISELATLQVRVDALSREKEGFSAATRERERGRVIQQFAVRIYTVALVDVHTLQLHIRWYSSSQLQVQALKDRERPSPNSCITPVRR